MTDTEAPTEAPDTDAGTALTVNPKQAWTIKGMPAEQREVIIAAARRSAETAAEFVWLACKARIEGNRQPMTPSLQTIPMEGDTGSGANLHHDPLSDLERLFEVIGKFIEKKPEPGNGALATDARRFLRNKLGVEPSAPRARKRAKAPAHQRIEAEHKAD
jgi:hypothetical protein